MKIPDLLVILGLINVLSIILITGSLFQNYTIFFENNHHILLNVTPIYAQDNRGILEDDDIFPDFKAEDGDGDGGKEKDGDGDGGKEKDGDGDGGKEKDGDGDGGKEKDGGNEERINENTNDFSPLSSGSPINTDDQVNPYGSPINTDDQVNPYDEVGQPVDQQLEQEAEDPVQVDRQSDQKVDQQTVDNEVNQTGQQQDIGEKVDQQTVGNEVNQTGQQQDISQQS